MKINYHLIYLMQSGLRHKKKKKKLLFYSKKACRPVRKEKTASLFIIFKKSANFIHTHEVKMLRNQL